MSVTADLSKDVPERVIVVLGNSNPHHQYPVFHPETGEHVGFRGAPAKHLQQSTTRMEMQMDFADPEHVRLALSTDNDRQLANIARALPDEHRIYSIGVQHVEQVVDVHAGGAKPAWVTSTDPAFAKAIGEYYGIPYGAPGAEQKALLTSVGRDAVHNQHLGTGTSVPPFNFVAVTASTLAPASGDTVLTGEINTTGGGLIRAQATYAHTNGTNTSTLSKTFTANSSDTLPVTIAQIGVFNGLTGGTLAYHTALTSTATLNVAGDNITVTETVTAG